MRFYLLNYAYEEGIRADAGGFRKVWELARQLKKTGHEPWVFIPEVEKPETGMSVPCVTYPVVEKIVLRPLSAYFMMFFKPWLHSFRYKPDIIYFRTAPTILPIFLAWLTGANFIMEINGDALTEERGKSANIFNDRIHFLRVRFICIAEMLNARASKMIVTLTDGLKKIVADRYRISDRKVFVLESGTNADHCRPMDSRKCRKLLQLDERKRYIVFIGVFYKHQGIDTLIEAAPEILKVNPDTVFLVGGGGPMAGIWREKVRNKGIESAFQFVGVVSYEQLPIFLNSADICVAPFAGNRGETSPLKLFDYMACGKPVVCSDIPSIRSLSRKCGGIVSVPPDDSRALASELLDLLENDLKRHQMGEAGRKYVEKHNSWQVIVRNLVDAIDKGV